MYKSSMGDNCLVAHEMQLYSSFVGVLLLLLVALRGKWVSARGNQVLRGLLHGHTLLHLLELHLREESNEKWKSQ